MVLKRSSEVAAGCRPIWANARREEKPSRSAQPVISPQPPGLVGGSCVRFVAWEQLSLPKQGS